jgi:FkbM family methyltransferase
VVEVAKALNGKPTLVVQVGVGTICHEVEVFQEEWVDVPLVGFDPNPAAVDEMVSRYPGQLIPQAVGLRPEGSVLFYSKQNHENGSSLLRIESDKSELTEHYVTMTSLDATQKLLPLHKLHDVLLWIDCEGTELDVLIGGEKFLSVVKMVNVEMTGKPPSPEWCSPWSVDTFLRDAGFYLVWIHTIRTRLGQYDAVYVRGDIFDPSICCVPSEIDRWKRRHS